MKLPLAVALGVLLGFGILTSHAQEPVVRDAAVLARQSLMQEAKAALGLLSNMSGHSLRFDKKAARRAKRQLSSTLRRIPRHFDAPHMDDHSRALPRIWQDKAGFDAAAARARRAARAIEPRSLPALRRSLPQAVSACLACHRSYRRPP
ncbi:c-type cytochrome [Lutimaribacter marinistellae]|uniref:C-type cytochrome n=1 Tax=Lutimaribacter marinistellae TaxID=1820329 RepID=A0ABV7TE74_9RHOB